MIECRNRYSKIIIKDVFYGRDNYFTCTSKIFNATKLCSQQTPTSVSNKVQLMCSGETKCKVPVRSEFLEKDGNEICPGIRKFLKVAYSCHQNPHIAMICPNSCANSCWPSCTTVCCNPTSPVTPKPQMTDNVSKQVTTIIHHAAMLSPEPVQCGSGCTSQCAPLCQPACCKLNAQVAPIMAGTCSSFCSPSCYPQCNSECCASKSNQPNHIQKPKPMMCDGSCPDSCAPSCDLRCCMQQTQQLQTPVQCPGSCPQHCAPSCNPTCCMQSSMMISHQSPPPAPQPSCPIGCSPQCAPLCQPTCCQTSSFSAQPVPQHSQVTCQSGCPSHCAPMCQPTCCGEQRQLLMPPQQIMPMMPAAGQFPPYMPVPPVQPIMPVDYSFMNGCSLLCTPEMCSTGCPTQCCIPQAPQKKRKKMNGVSPHEFEARRNYQEMLRSFREKQLESYLSQQG